MRHRDAPGVEYSIRGQVVFYAEDAKSKVVVWRRTATKTLHDPQKARKNRGQEIDIIVGKSFKGTSRRKAGSSTDQPLGTRGRIPFLEYFQRRQRNDEFREAAVQANYDVLGHVDGGNL